MKKFKMSDMKGGWFVGDFEPSVLRTKNFEVGYHTHKKGDDDGIGSAYIHKMGEEKNGVEPILALSSDGHLWLAGGSYTCPYAGITN